MQHLKRFLAGRYGSDQLGVCLVVLSLLLSLGFSFTPWPQLGSLLALALLLYGIFRMLSRNIPARERENAWFLKLVRPIASRLQWLYLSLRFGKKLRYFLCPHCGRLASVPRGTGNVTITCKGCQTRYDKKA